MDKAFWQERWQRHDIGFHQPHIHEQLKRLWPTLNIPQGSEVFVPLAGKSRDMAWLADQGHHIIGVELSDIAVAEFFEEAELSPEQTSVGAFDIYSAAPFRLYCGDFFDLPAAALSGVRAAYDRAALIALPPHMRVRYAETLSRILPQDACIFLISIEYPEHEIAGPPFSVRQQEIETLFGAHYSIDVLESRDGLAASDNLRKRGITRLEETAYFLRRRA